METTLPPKTTDVREYRRFCACNLHQQGLKQRQIAAALGVTQGAVSQWLKIAREQGTDALRSKPLPGAKPRLTEAQKQQLPDRLSRGAEHYGFRGNVWTRARIRQVIEREYGVRYHISHISRLVRQIGWSLQKPVRRARQRDQEAVEQWQQERWPTLKKSVRTKGVRPSS